MKKIDDKYKLLAGRLSGEYSEEEQKKWHAAQEQHHELNQHRKILSQFWNNYFPSVESGIKKRITGNAMLHIFGNRKRRTSHPVLWYRAIAILVVSLGVSVLWGMFDTTEGNIIQYAAGTGEVKELVLPDGTKVNLNAGSSLIIEEGFKTGRRQAVLLGEGYFDIAKDRDKPFEISTTHLKIRVVGTHFDLMAYPGDKYVFAWLDEGKIQLNGDFNRHHPVYVSQGQEAVLNKESGELVIKSHMKNHSAAWKDGKIIFYDNTLAEIAAMLNRKFNVEIIIMDDELKNYKFSGDFSNVELFELLGHLSDVRPFHFNVKGDYIVITK